MERIHEKTTKPIESKKTSRTRRILAGTLGATILSTALYGADVSAQSPSQLPDMDTYKNPVTEIEHITAGTLELSNEQSFRESLLGFMNYVPDGPITFWTTPEGNKRYLLTGGDMNQGKEWTGNATYMMELSNGITLKDALASGQITSDNFLQVFTPDVNVNYRKDYVGITSVLQTDPNNLDHLWGITHAEERTTRNASADYTATIGLVESTNGGITWEDKGPLITGTDVKEPGGGKVSGAGQPTAIYNPETGYVNGLYIDWSATGEHPDQIYAFRMKVNEDGSLENVEYLTDIGYSETKENLKPAIPVPDDNPDLIYTALPDLSFNTELNEYIAVGEADNGFWMAKSKDLENWTEPEIIYNFEKYGGRPHSVLQIGEKWDSYPTFLDESQANSQITGKSGIFYHSTGDNLAPHEPATLDAEIVAK